MRTTFNEVAETYDEVRPGYTEQAIEDIISISGIPQSGKILEVGCGTGQATKPFAERGYSMHCLEMGDNLARIAVEKFRGYPNVQIENVAFEDWNIKPSMYDIVLSATAFHWIPSEVGFPKAAEALRDNGYLALLSNMHPSPYAGFFERVQAIYQEIVPEWKDPREGLSSKEKIDLGEKNINSYGLFESVTVKRYHWSKTFATEDYLKLLYTFSDHRNLEANTKDRLYNNIGELIDKEYGGFIDRPYLTVLYLAKK